MILFGGGVNLKDKILNSQYIKCNCGVDNGGYLYKFIGGLAVYVGWVHLSELAVYNKWGNIYSSDHITLDMKYPQAFDTIRYSNVSIESSSMWSIVSYEYGTDKVPSFYAVSAAEYYGKDVLVSFLTIGHITY